MHRAVISKMDAQISAWEQTGDDRRHFLRCYRLMTSNMLNAIEHKQFIDNVWVNKLLKHFADYYFNALHAFEMGKDVPAIWNEVFLSTQNRQLPVIQSIIIGVNAHINYDLVFCLRDMLADEWSLLTANEKEQRYNDHRFVNQVIADTIDEVQEQIIEPGNYTMQVIDLVFGRLDEYFLSMLITSWREEVWENAIDLIEAGNEDKGVMLDKIDKIVNHKMAVLNF
jgi:hypothetical protein